MHKAIVKLSFKFLVLGILTGSFWFFYNRDGFSQTAPPPRIVVAEQPDVPLLLLSTFVDSSDPLRPRYGYSITNNSDKPIRAYTIQESVSLGPGTPIIGTELVHSPAVKLFLKPHESRQKEGGRGSIYQTPPVEVELSVDFVEFADGTRWGVDANKSGETLDGLRAGGKAAVKRYREILVKEGMNGLEQALGSQDLIQPDNHPKSAKWIDGFNLGVSIVKSRLSAAKKRDGRDEARRELEKSFDSTEGRQEP